LPESNDDAVKEETPFQNNQSAAARVNNFEWIEARGDRWKESGITP